MRIVLVIILFCFSTAAWAEDCHRVIKETDLVEKVVDGEKVYVVSVDEVNKGCFYPVETAGLIKKLQGDVKVYRAIAEDYKANQEAVTKLNSEYSELIQRHEKTLNDSIDLSEKYDKLVTDYKQLNEDYDKLVEKFDKLAGKYRDFALTAGSPFSVEVGAGLTDQGDAVGLLGAGVNVYKTWEIKAWGLLHEDFGAFLGGASFRF